MKYLSPTIGCYFFAEDYIKFIKNLRHYTSLELIKVEFNDSKNYSKFQEKNRDYIIGKLNDVEIVFLHYSSFDEAKEKWQRRVKRINYHNLLVKFSDQNCFVDECFNEFINLDYKNKLFITGNPKFAELENVVFLEQFQMCGYAKDDIKPSLKKISLKRLFNNLK